MREVRLPHMQLAYANYIIARYMSIINIFLSFVIVLTTLIKGEKNQPPRKGLVWDQWDWKAV